MKYVEELDSGDFFNVDHHKYIITTDVKPSGKRMAISVQNGSIRWFPGDTICAIQDIYYRDEENNILLVKDSPPPDSVEQAIRKVQPKINPSR
jgi:hypothetical protein